MWRNVSVWDIDSSMVVKMPCSCYWIVIGLSTDASNFTNGAINTHNRISGTIRMSIKNVCASKKPGAERGGSGVKGGRHGRSKQNLTKGMKSVCVWERCRGRKMVAHSSFLCHKLSWAFTCSVFNVSVIWGLGWYKVYAAALFKCNHSPWRVILSLTIITLLRE